MKRVARTLLLAAFAWVTMAPALAHVAALDFASTAGTYTEITGGTVLGSTDNDDEMFNNDAVGDFPPVTGAGFPIGFAFTLNGTSYDRFAVSTNGWIRLGTGDFQIGVQSDNNFTPLSTAGPGFLAAVSAAGADLQGQSASELSYLTSGEPGSLVLTVQWKHYRKYGVDGDSFNFQIRLREGSNTIEFVYGTMTSTVEPKNVQVGFRDGTADGFTNRTTASDWSASIAGDSNTAGMTLSDTVFPASGLTLSWTPQSALVAFPAHLPTR